MVGDRTPFGILADGRQVELYTLKNAEGVHVSVTNYGGTVTDLKVPDRFGHVASIVLRLDTLTAYVEDRKYTGAVVGRFANRISRGSFCISGNSYQLSRNEGGHHLHGGHTGLNRHVWQAEPFTHGADTGLRLTTVSPDGEEGYPGTLRVTLTYLLTAGSTLRIDYEAITDRSTPVNLTHHSYFNLAGADAGSILDHAFTIDADAYLPVGEDLIPTGEIRPVDETPFDFRRAVGMQERAQHAALYDHHFVLAMSRRPLSRAARVRHPGSGRILEVYTTEPGVQLYTGHARASFTLETQQFPDAPNHPGFPSTILHPGERLRSSTEYRFLTDHDHE